MERMHLYMTGTTLVPACFGVPLLSNALPSQPTRAGGEWTTPATLAWQDKLPFFAKEHIKLKASEKCELVITYTLETADLSQARVYS